VPLPAPDQPVFSWLEVFRIIEETENKNNQAEQLLNSSNPVAEQTQKTSESQAKQ